MIGSFTRPRPPALIAAASTLAAIVLVVGGFSAETPESRQLLHSSAVTLFAIGLYATGALPGHLTALLFFLFAMLLSVAPAEIVFSGFHSTALWLVFGGLILGVAVDHTGLGARIARGLAGMLSGSYLRVIAGLVLMTLGISFLLPSSLGRIALLVPIVLSLADELGYRPGRPGRTGIVIATALGCFVPPFSILPANIPNLVMLGAAESLYDLRVTYGGYLLLHFPVTGLLKALAIIVLVTLLFPDGPPERAAIAERTPMTAGERRLATILAVAVAFWVTDFWHEISPAWIGLAAGLVCLFPWFKLVPYRAFENEVNHSAFFYVAGIVSLGAVAAYGGFGEWLGLALIDAMNLEPGNQMANYFALAGTGIAVGLGTTLPGIPAVMTPLADLLADATGIARETVIMTQVVSFSTVVLPYQAPPLVLAIHLGGIRALDMARVTIALALVTVVLFIPLNFGWWRFLGLFS